MATIHAFFDESGKHKDHPVVTFCGVCAPQSKLQQFDDAWNGLLRHYGLSSLHMAQASRISEHLSDRLPKQTLPERIEALKPFADCINDHLELGLIQAWDVKGFNSLSPKAKANLGSPDDPYYIAFARGITELIDYVHGSDRFSLICDDDQETAFSCYQHYREIRRIHEEVKEKTVSLTFADDEYFPCLQAADMVAFLSRREASHLFYGKTSEFLDLFKYLVVKESSPSKMLWMKMFATEENIKKLSDDLDSLK